MGGYFSYPAKAQVALEPTQTAEPTNTITEPPVATEVVTAAAEVVEVAEPTNIINESPQVAEVAEPTHNPNIVAETQKKSKKAKKSKNAHPK